MTEQRRRQLSIRLVELMERMSVQARSHSPVNWADPALTMPQARILFFLSEQPRRMSELSTYLGRGMPSATSMIDRLVSKGKVERVEDPTDRRVVVCRLTSKGRDIVEKFARISHMRIEAIAGVLTAEELELVIPAMEILSDAMGRQGAAAISNPADGAVKSDQPGLAPVASRP